MKTAINDRTTLADAIAELVEHLHQHFPGIKTKTDPPLVDEDIALEIEAPPQFRPEDVETWCQRKCISLEDKYDIYILPLIL